jgi:hypothetical protein
MAGNDKRGKQMLTFTITLDSLAFYIAVFDVVVLLSYVLWIFQRNRKRDRTIKIISDFIVQYFSNSGTAVQVTMTPTKNKNFIAMVESEPIKRFRYSNIIESNLISHIYKLTGFMVEKIYWRFPVMLSKDTVVTLESDEQQERDLYFEEPALAQSHSEYKVSEVTWDQFEKEQVKTEGK